MPGMRRGVLCREYGSFSHGNGEIAIGTLCPEALDELKRFYEALDPDTVRRRFLAPVKEFDWYVEQLASRDSVVVVAVLRGRGGERVVGSAEAVATGEPGTVEAGIVVERSYRRMGIGKRLAVALYLELLRRGYRRVRAYVHPDNTPALRLAERLGFRRVPGEPGVVALELELS